MCALSVSQVIIHLRRVQFPGLKYVFTKYIHSVAKRMMTRREIVDACLCSSGGWWLWGEADQDTKQEQEEEEDPFPAEVVKSSADQEKDSKLDEITEIKSPSEVEQFNRESFEQKLEEVIKAHESHHLSKESHLEHLDGDHDQDFDHKAFLGEEAEEFKDLTPEESKERLKPIVVKIDLNNDTVIGVI